jgi:hypothetical protein
MKTCRKISTIFFEEDEGELNNFLISVQAKIDENVESTGEKRIQSTVFLILLLDEFHASKDTSGMQKSIGVMDNPFESPHTNYHKQEENKRKLHSSGKLIYTNFIDIPDEEEEDSNLLEQDDDNSKFMLC